MGDATKVGHAVLEISVYCASSRPMSVNNIWKGEVTRNYAQGNLAN